ncbi:metal cation transporting p-type ATPase CtpH domain protein [Mycobacterium xenopi 4042]|uniref:Metal cation transporting P-type ATPase CtpH domain protein n=1 Tax=Mycobacterium xenopi 4042 TaxID=1299334 RepID=X8DJE6_MYCXE|nr:metal cation transporting p-type ATPase CtpH domain protein [Mycobacterium xenopi 4042]
MGRSTPLRAVAMGLQATSALVGASVNTAAATATSLASAGSGLPPCRFAKVPRCCPAAFRRDADPALLAWRGPRLDRGTRVNRSRRRRARARRARRDCRPARVTAARLNRPLSRVVVDIDGDRVSLRDLCRVVAEAEARYPRAPRDRAARPPACRGRPAAGDQDGNGQRQRGGLGAALVGRALRWPPMPNAVVAAAAVATYQPRVRRLLEDRIGKPTADTVLELAMAAAETVTLSLGSLAVDMTVEALKAAESVAEAKAWNRLEPRLAGTPTTRPATRRRGHAAAGDAADRHAAASALVQAVAAALIGAATRSIDGPPPRRW